MGRAGAGVCWVLFRLQSEKLLSAWKEREREEIIQRYCWNPSLILRVCVFQVAALRACKMWCFAFLLPIIGVHWNLFSLLYEGRLKKVVQLYSCNPTGWPSRTYRAVTAACWMARTFKQLCGLTSKSSSAAVVCSRSSEFSRERTCGLERRLSFVL